MSRPHRRPPSRSHGYSSASSSSAYLDQSLTATTSSLQGFHLTGTANDHYLYPASASSSSAAAPRTSPYVSGRATSGVPAYASSPYDTVDPSVLSSRAASSSSAYGQSSTSYSYLESSPSNMNYQSYTADPMRSSYGVDYSRASTQAGFPMPSTESPMSRSMSGAHVPNILPSSTYYEEVRHIGREFARQRRRLNKPRRDRKITYRQTVLPSNTSAGGPGSVSGSGSSQAEDVSGSIDSFTAQSTSPYENPVYTLGGYPSVSRSPYESAYSSSYGPSNPSVYAATIDPRGGSYSSYSNARPINPSPHESSSRETTTKPQCWEHGCNGRQFSTFSNLLRHQREKSGASAKSVCHRCGAEFTRKTARDGHLNHDKCKAKSPLRRP